MRMTFRFAWLTAVASAAALLLPAPPAHGGTPFDDTVQAWSSLALQGPGRQVQDLRLAAGHATFTVASGWAAPVVAGDQVVGLFLEGKGSLEYTTKDALDVSVAPTNVRENTALKAEPQDGKVVIRDEFTHLLWLNGGEPLPEIQAEGPTTTLDRPFAEHRTKFGRVHASPIAHQFAAWRLEGAPGPFVRAEVSGGKASFVYTLDGMDAKSETLSTIHESDYRPGVSYLRVLSDQPVGRDRRDAMVPRFLLSNVDLDVTASDGNDVAMTVTETFAGVGGATSVLLLNLYDTTFGRNIHDQRHLHVKGVFDQKGAPVPFHHAVDELAVGLPSPLQPRTAVTLRFELEGDILARPNGDNYWALGVAPWFPQPDLGHQYFTVHAKLKVKKPFVPLVPGSTVHRGEDGDWNVLETRIDKPVQFMVMLAGKYVFDEATENGLTVRVASYGSANRKAFRKLVNLSQKMIAYYQQFLGPFPFDEFNVIEINDLGWGQAPAGTMFITSEAFNPLGDPLNQLYSGGINERFAHEIAHQYWGHVVKMPSHEEQWLTESFAEISAGLLIRDLRGQSDFRSLTAVWENRAKKVCDDAPIPMANRLTSESDSLGAWTTRTYLLYAKGPWLLECIRREIGDEKFLVFLRSTQATMEWKFGTTKTVEMVLEAITKRSWQPFFDANYWGTGMPKG